MIKSWFLLICYLINEIFISVEIFRITFIEFSNFTEILEYVSVIYQITYEVFKYLLGS